MPLISQKCICHVSCSLSLATRPDGPVEIKHNSGLLVQHIGIQTINLNSQTKIVYNYLFLILEYP